MFLAALCRNSNGLVGRTLHLLARIFQSRLHLDKILECYYIW